MVNLVQGVKEILGLATPRIQWLWGFTGINFFGTSVALVDGAAIAVDGSVGSSFVLTAASNAARAFSAPTNMPAGATFDIQLKNTSGGALTVTTFNAAYHGAPTLPANNMTRVYTFLWDGAVAYLKSQSPADMAI